ncbi:MAG: hypothetical protein IH630_08225 [Thermoplasmata archaeon]|nr:hypothetical protein [Thermoplasmata archaeon]TFG68063.1 MAG: hypothetical protein E4H25_06525 [Methanomassiliicoccus sp.]
MIARRIALAIAFCGLFSSAFMAGGLSAQCASISENGSLASVSDDLAAQERNPERSWTIGMYWAADNNIDSMTDTFLDIWLDNLWNRDDVSLAIFIDRLELPANISTVTEEGWIERECMGDVNSSDPETLSDFIEFFMTEQYLEAEHYMLVVQDHGLGYLGICVDEGEEGRPWMSIDGLGRALDKATATTGKKLDIIDLDACTLATVEVAYELRNKASYLVASEIAVPFDGINYMALLDGLSEEPDILPLDLACKMVDDCEEWYSAPLGTYPTLYPYMQDFTTLSVMDLSKMDGVGTAFAALSEELLPKDGTLITPFNTAAQQHFIAMWENNMGCGFNSDIRGMFGELAEVLADSHPVVASLCKDIVSAADDVIVKNWESWRTRDRLSGMAVFVPPSIGIYDVNWDSLYRVYDTLELDFVTDSGWDEILLKYFCTMRQHGV